MTRRGQPEIKSNFNEHVRGRFFIVGCARSGTTLLQNLLAAHHAVQSFPESHFFRTVINESGVKKYLGIANKNGVHRLARFFDALNRPDLKSRMSPYALTVKYYSRVFARALDTVTLDHKKSYWVEKTPMHLYHTDMIAQYIRNTRFIHMVRNGEDVVASLFEATNSHPQHWGGAKDIAACVTRWNHDLNITLNCLSKKKHAVLTYEDLVANPRREMITLCDFLGVAYHQDMIDHRGSSSAHITRDFETWKDAVKKPIAKSDNRKFDTLLDPEQKKYVKKNLDYQTYGTIAAAISSKKKGACPSPGTTGRMYT